MLVLPASAWKEYRPRSPVKVEPTMLLPRGITGFFTLGQQPPASIDPSTFKRCCFEVARSTGRKVVSFEPAYSISTKNFHSATLDSEKGSIVVLCNAHHPIMAFQQGGNFIDAPTLASAFQHDFQILSKTDANQPPVPALTNDLDVAEIKQMRYWKPKRIGDIIFNLWD